jgi:hypothetical protein
MQNHKNSLVINLVCGIGVLLFGACGRQEPSKDVTSQEINAKHPGGPMAKRVTPADPQAAESS